MATAAADPPRRSTRPQLRWGSLARSSDHRPCRLGRALAESVTVSRYGPGGSRLRLAVTATVATPPVTAARRPAARTGVRVDPSCVAAAAEVADCRRLASQMGRRHATTRDADIRKLIHKC